MTVNVLMVCDDNGNVDDDDDDGFSPDDDDDVTITHYIPFFKRIQQMDEQWICLLLIINCILIEFSI